ncbi:hypothetical protein PIB30_033154, partial [Stylosanthes scabra]|nr:hypothetical protein [Stylosanthes scabra]
MKESIWKLGKDMESKEMRRKAKMEEADTARPRSSLPPIPETTIILHQGYFININLTSSLTLDRDSSSSLLPSFSCLEK